MRTIHTTIPTIPITVTLEQLRNTCEILGLTLVEAEPTPAEKHAAMLARDKKWEELRELWKEQERINKRIEELEDECCGYRP